MDILKKKPILVFAVILLVISAALIVAFSTQNKKSPDTQPTDKESLPTSVISPQAQSTLSLTPNPVTVDDNGNGTINVEIETNTNQVTAVQLELQYDPAAIGNISIKPSQFFAKPVELLRRIDSQNGRITYMLGISPAQEPINGKGVVAQISFVKTANSNISETEFKFSRTANSESIVAATGVDQSVLLKTNDTKILLNR